jgi:hypothetical protein
MKAVSACIMDAGGLLVLLRRCHSIACICSNRAVKRDYRKFRYTILEGRAPGFIVNGLVSIFFLKKVFIFFQF